MTKEGMNKTAATYLDPAFVRTYAERNLPDSDMIKQARMFVDHVPGKRLIDVGCGPGHHARLFAEWGYEVVGVDASAMMIQQATSRASAERSPSFRVADMRIIGEMFPENSFDGAWLSA